MGRTRTATFTFESDILVHFSPTQSIDVVWESHRLTPDQTQLKRIKQAQTSPDHGKWKSNINSVFTSIQVWVWSRSCGSCPLFQTASRPPSSSGRPPVLWPQRGLCGGGFLLKHTEEGGGMHMSI